MYSFTRSKNFNFFPILVLFRGYSSGANQIYATIQNGHCKRFIFEITRSSRAGGHHVRSLVVCSNWQNIWKCPSGLISPTPMNISSRYCTCINYHPPMNPVKCCQDLNSKWPTCRHFCLLKFTKYLKMLSVRINISNTNEHFFPILYTWINYHPPMNPVKCRQDPIQNCQLIAIFVCWNWQNIWKCCPSG